MGRKREIWVVLGVMLVGIWGIAGLWKVAGLPTSHDSIAHMARMYAYAEGLKDGIFPVLWARRMFWGIGSPVLMLNYQMPYYFAMVWHGIGLNFDDSFKTVLSLSHILSGILMYWTLRSRYKTLPSLLGAILYLLSPYRFLNIYVRAAMGEVVAAMFPPIILAGLWRRSFTLQTIGWAGLFLSHPVGSALYSGIFLGYTVLASGLRDIGNTLKKFFLPYLLALMIAAFNILPTLALTKYTYYSPANSNTLRNFPTLRQLVYSPWGYGFSTEDNQDQMSFQVGIIQWLLAGMTLGIIVWKRKENKETWELKYYTFVFVVAIFLMLQKIATPVYIHLGMGKIIDYPWRILMIFSFIAAVCAPQIMKLMKTKAMQIGLAVLLISGAIYTNRNHIRINLVWPWPSDSFQHGTGDAYGEYAARSRETHEESEFYDLAEFTAGEGKIQVVKDISNETIIVIEANQTSIVRLNMMYFPGWKVRINGENVGVDVTKSPTSTSSQCFVTRRVAKHIDDSGLIACHVKEGTTEIEAKYEALPVQRSGNLITLSGIGILLWQIFRSFYRPTTNVKRLSKT